ncbi:hypothetical protein HMSSN036_38610 [Paenibacillus macerans]|nr:hypothetical protein HMSSN036_38610 [Paenibacillus macerans]
MKQTAAASIRMNQPPLQSKRETRWRRLRRDKWLYLLLTPGVLYFIIFKYVPMWGVLLAFKNYQPFLGFWKSEWVGFEHFRVFFQNPDFLCCCATRWCCRFTT